MGNPKRLCFMVSSIAWKMGNVKGYLKKNMQNGRHPGVGDAHARVTERWKAEGKFLWIFMGLTEWGRKV